MMKFPSIIQYGEDVAQVHYPKFVAFQQVVHDRYDEELGDWVTKLQRTILATDAIQSVTEATDGKADIMLIDHEELVAESYEDFTDGLLPVVFVKK